MNSNARIIYTDGAAPNNQNGCKQGGIGVAVLDQNGEVELTISQPVQPLPGCSYTTNSRCELLAFVTGLEAAQNDDTIYSDSKYVVDGYNQWLKSWVANGWRKSGNKKIEHLDLWQQVYALKQVKRQVSVCWVKGHSTSYGNFLSDKLARNACS